MGTTIAGGVCAARGFSAAGGHCGVRKNTDRKDLALIVSSAPCSAAAMFTTNRVKAAPVQLGMELAAAWRGGGTARAIVCNSGNANACTGAAGLAAARKMAAAAAAALGVDAAEVLPASTGVIGVPLPIGAVESGVGPLAASLREDGSDSALDAIMTTDTRRKSSAIEFALAGKTVRIGAVAKGAGMIRPSLATMLCFVTTDAAIAPAPLEAALRVAVAKSFNMVTVDGDTSTNDTVAVLANGLAGNPRIEAPAGADWEAFSAALETVCASLARQIAADGEGATKLVECRVTGALDEAAAAVLAKSVVSSNLVKAALFGSDANWGRVLCAMGYSGAVFDPAAVKLRFESRSGSVLLYSLGSPLDFSEDEAKKVLSEKEIAIVAELGDGSGSATAWGCDLTYDYVKINGDYRS